MIQYSDYVTRDNLAHINVEIVADSMYPVWSGNRLTTFIIDTPEAGVLSHISRHRALSLNVSSNRAVKTEDVKQNVGYIPDWKTEAQKGMQPAEFLDYEKSAKLEIELNKYLKQSLAFVEILNEHNIAKEIKNRYLYPFRFTRILATGTSQGFANFISLRDSALAEQNIQIVARKMKTLLEESTPFYLETGEWHLPFINAAERKEYGLATCTKMSAARCARTSYSLPGEAKRSNPEADIRLAERLLRDKHYSPFEMQATPATLKQIYGVDLPEGVSSEFYGNLHGWIQLRKLMEYTKGTSSLIEQQKRKLNLT